MLRISDIYLRDFRSYNRLHLEVPGKLTVLVGPNAIGKTNIVEAIQLLTSMQSFRHSKTAELLRYGASNSRVEIKASDGNRELEIALALEEKARHYKLNGKAKRASDLRGLVPSVAFTPDDLNLIKGSPSKRRDSLDALGAQLNKNYHVIQKDFEKVLHHKNKLLKDGAKNMLDAINELFVRVGSQLENYRHALFTRIEPEITRKYQQISGGEKLSGTYVSSWMNEENFYEDLQKAVEANTAAELNAGRTLVGPNHDRIEFAINDMDAGKFASQGQQRSAVLAWKLAEAEIIEDLLGTLPILLLDDVMSELDGDRRSALVDYLQRDSQTFITTTNMDYFDKKAISDAHIVKLPLQTG
ncbi:DNA replication/repair protein RecF [Adlercreutzia sp. ZJ154]|uniref:DNA replication/repair protein RecF n=1 Tax=Adlercreutzia sp. ZJ154 TaxID=2709790 RepID=UPI0013EA8AF9|nr:DNA replication and repair protein RecF [Adlercreutzia sp. ZJ154]